MLLEPLMAALAFSAIVVSAPTEHAKHTKKRGHFSVKQVAHGQYLKDPAVEVLRMYHKHNIEPPSELVAAAANASTAEPASKSKRQNGSDGNGPADDYDTYYTSPVTIGDNEPTFYLDFDTGSADLWVFSTDLAPSQQVNHNIYDPSASSTAQFTGNHWEIRYQTANTLVGGDVYLDTVNIGGAQAYNQGVEAARFVSANFQAQRLDGLVGLSFSSINRAQPQVATFFDNVKDSLDAPLFTATLKYHDSGSYDFGFIDNNKYTGDIVYTGVNNYRGFWEFYPTGVGIGGSFYGHNIDAIADTGSTLVYLDSDVVQFYYGQANVGAYLNTAFNPALWVFPCDANLPDFSLIINGEARTTPGYFLNWAPLNDGSGNCVGGLQYQQTPYGIIGDLFLKSQFVVFDNSGPQIGFAQQF